MKKKSLICVLFVLLLSVPVVVAAEPYARLDLRDYWVHDGDRVAVNIELKNLENATSVEVTLGYPADFDYLYVDEWDDWNFEVKDKPFGPEGMHYLRIIGETDDAGINGSKTIKVVFYANCKDSDRCESYFELGRVYINDERIDTGDEREMIIVTNPFYEPPTTTTTVVPTPTPEPEYIVIISSNPSGANVYIDDELKGTTPAILRLKSGVYALKLTKSGYQALVDVLKVNRDTTKNYELKKEETAASKPVVTPTKPVVTPTTQPPTTPTTKKADYSWVGWLIGLGILVILVVMFWKTRRETIEETTTFIVGENPHEWEERKTLYDGGISFDKMKGYAFITRAGEPIKLKRADGTVETVWLVDKKTGAGIILERGEVLKGKEIDIDGVDEEGKPAKVKFRLNTNPKMLSDILSANLLREMAKLKPSMGQVIVALFAGLLIGYLFGLIF